MNEEDPFIGKVVNEVEIVRRIGSASAMGVVYEGRDRQQSGIRVAVKMPTWSGEPVRKLIQRFDLEAKIAEQIREPRIVGAYRHDVDYNLRVLVMVMEYVDGESLQDELARAPGKGLPVDRAVRIGIDMCGALTHAWAYKLVHRDVKPGNILVDRYDLARLCDFGIAKLGDIVGGGPLADTEGTSDRESVYVGRTMPGFGDAPYMSPEQWKASEDIDHRSDIYSLGCTLYHLLTGTLPFPGPDRHDFEWQHEENPRPDASLHNPEIPKELGQLVIKMMAIEPSKRFQSTEEVEVALRKIDLTPDEPDKDKEPPFLPGVENLSPAQRALVYGEVFGPPVSLRTRGHGGFPKSP